MIEDFYSLKSLFRALRRFFLNNDSHYNYLKILFKLAVNCIYVSYRTTKRSWISGFQLRYSCYRCYRLDETYYLLLNQWLDMNTCFVACIVVLIPRSWDKVGHITRNIHAYVDTRYHARTIICLNYYAVHFQYTRFILMLDIWNTSCTIRDTWFITCSTIHL